MSLVVGVLLGVCLGAAVGYLVAAARAVRAEATLAAERQATAEKLRLLEQAEARMKDAFAALSQDALARSQDQLLKLATAKLGEFQTGASKDLAARQTAIDELLKPVKVSLEKMDGTLKEIDTRRAETGATIGQLVKSVHEDQQQLRRQTDALVNALRKPQVRGRWGEVQLKRVVEIAGMVDHCDFLEQVTTEGEEGRLRPDMIVKLPGEKTIVVDSKAPLIHFLDALETSDEAARAALLLKHARAVRDYVDALSAKSYSRQFEHSPDMVVLFLPGESFFSAALESDPSLLEHGASRNVILATPTTLISLLKAISYGWRQEKLADEAREIARIAGEIYDALSVAGGHLSDLGRGLDRAVESYNRTIGSIERTMLSPARKMQALGVSGKKEIGSVEAIESQVRPLVAPELGSEKAAVVIPAPDEPA